MLSLGTIKKKQREKKLLRMNTPIAFMLSLKEKDGTILH